VGGGNGRVVGVGGTCESGNRRVGGLRSKAIFYLFFMQRLFSISGCKGVGVRITFPIKYMWKRPTIDSKSHKLRD
jgi:hypothetical protein